MSSLIQPLRRLALVAVSLCVWVPTVGAQECPELIASMSLEGPPPRHIAVYEDYAYLRRWGWGVDFFAVVDVASPELPAALWAGSGLCGRCYPGETYNLEASGGVVFDLLHQCPPGLGHFLCVIDARLPESPVVLPADFTLHHFSLDSLAVSDGYLYVAGYPYLPDYPYNPEYVGFKVIDVLEPSFPVEVGSFHYLPESPPSHFDVDVAVSGNHAVMVAGTRLTVIDVAIPSSPIEVGFLELPESGERVAVSGSHAYVVTRTGEWPDAESTLRVIDVSSPSSLVEVGSVATQGKVVGFAVDSSSAYISTAGDLRVIDVRVPSSPVEVGFVAPPDQRFEDVTVSGRYVYAVGGDGSDPAGRLYVFDTRSRGCLYHEMPQERPLAIE